MENEISSPTFTIVNEHQKDNVNIYHLDVYRLSNIDEFYAIGGTEYFANGICIIEWGELLRGILPPNYIEISFTKDTENENIRYLAIITCDKRLEEILRGIIK